MVFLERNRLLLDTLNREVKNPFKIIDAATILKIDFNKARRLVAYWAARGWLTRVKRDYLPLFRCEQEVTRALEKVGDFFS